MREKCVALVIFFFLIPAPVLCHKLVAVEMVFASFAWRGIWFLVGDLGSSTELMLYLSEKICDAFLVVTYVFTLCCPV